jgi:starch phosphorylase
VAELMRLLIDVHGYRWDVAWNITRRSMAYTNHTLLPEALETWSVELLATLLPRHLLIINRINHEFLEELGRRFPGDVELMKRTSIYQEGQPKRVRMANLATIGAFSVNGVAELHTKLLKSRVLSDFHRVWPEKFNNKTNGVTPRRWLLSANPPLASLISKTIGPEWPTNLAKLKELSAYSSDPAFQDAVASTKREAKVRLSNFLRWYHGQTLDPDAIFDVQVKRIHEYKRQLLNILHVIHLYRALERRPDYYKHPRTFLFGGKAAPSYTMAKLIVKLINDVSTTVNNHPEISRKLRVFFVPDYSVSKAELMIPAADVSEQISTAGFEASGTGNMKFMLNGALTVGTLDGANVEMAEEVGNDNIFIFGLMVEDVTKLHERGYRPRDWYESNPNIREVIDLLSMDYFNRSEPGIYRPIVDALLGSDHYLHLADFDAYRRTHLAVDQTYGDRRKWMKMAVENIARGGKFSSDRTILDYARDIWKVVPVTVPGPSNV